MNYSRNGLHLTEQFEGCQCVAYKDSGGIPTIGYGHTQGVKMGMSCTIDQAEAWLMQDIQSAAATVNKLVRVPLTQGEFDALTDFVFNAGSGNFLHSTLLTLLNKEDFQGAANEFEKWDKCAGQVVSGLLRRRQAEAAEFRANLPDQEV